MSNDSTILKENHDKIDKMATDIAVIKTHIEYIKEKHDDVDKLEIRVDKLETVKDRLDGGLSVTKIVGGALIGILYILEIYNIFFT